jgi:SAM-dependent methyltransferase
MPDVTYTMVRCRGCGHLYIHPRPDAATLQALYDAAFYQGRIDHLAAAKTSVHGGMLEHVRGLTPPLGRLLDIGCGLGDFASNLPEYFCAGYETAEFALEHCRRGRLVVYGPDPGCIPRDYYDTVTAIEVLEHAFSPREIFKLAYDCLRPGGVFYYTTFPFDGWTPDCSWGQDYIQPEQHLNFFTRPVVEEYLRRAGFSRTMACGGLLPLGVK